MIEDNRECHGLHCRDKILKLGDRTYVMGILNVTPDSFSDGGLYQSVELAVRRAREMVGQGADIVDIGGESTRPGAQPVSLKEELGRVLPVIEELARVIDVPISVDTMKAEVARRALEAGAHIINDVSGLHADPGVARVVADYGAAVVIMHMKGTPGTMQHNPTYECVVSEIGSYLKRAVEGAVAAGIPRDRIIVDPGIGFGKTTEHNLTILRRLREFKALGQPLLVGTSRKSLIGNVLNLPANERLEGTAATVAASIMNGADIIRVHDVKEMKRVAVMTDAIVRS